MATIYAPPKEVGNPPQFEPGGDFRKRMKDEEAWVAELAAWAKQNGNGSEAGEEIRFPVGDGYARYIVLSMRPVKLIHIPTFDAYSFQYANRLTAADIREKIRSARAMRKLFSSKPLEATA